MTTIDTHPDTAVVAASRPGVVQDVVDWAVTADHKRIGRLFIGFGLLGLLATLVFGVLIGIERADADSFDIFKAAAADQVVTLQRVLLGYGAVVPLLLGLAIAVVPLQLGARAIAFPRVALAGFYVWFAGVILAIVSLSNEGGPGGTDRRYTGLFLTSTAMIALGLLAAALCVAATVLTTRTPGMRLLRVPAFSWASLIGAVALLLTLPVLIGDVVYLFVDYRHAQEAFFQDGQGIMSWAGWAFTQPQLFAVAIPAFGIFAELAALTANARQPMRGVLFAAIGLTSVSIVAAVTQVPITLPWIDQAGGQKIEKLLPYLFFYGLPILGMVVVLGMGALVVRTGKPRLVAPTVFAVLSLLLMLGGWLALTLQNIENVNLIGTSWEEGATTATSLGAVLAALGGIAYWGPKLWGRRMPDGPVVGLALLGALATVLASAPLMIAGFAKQPTFTLGGFDYSGPQGLWNVLSAAGFALGGVVVLGFAALALRSFRSGEDAGSDPWGGQTLEWATSSPPPEHNFPELIAISSPEPLLDAAATKGGEG